jgi:hypothetical protein
MWSTIAKVFGHSQVLAIDSYISSCFVFMQQTVSYPHSQVTNFVLTFSLILSVQAVVPA